MKLDEHVRGNVVGMVIIINVLLCLVLLGFLFSCTVTLQNTISTGSSDAVDSAPVNDPVVSPTISLPVKNF
jgi:hypothetical protein